MRRWKDSIMLNSVNQQTLKRNKWERKDKSTWTNQKRIKNITGINKHLSIITLNVNGFNSPMKDENWLTGLENKIQLFVDCKRHISLTKINTD
jgi:hypothetical protein